MAMRCVTGLTMLCLLAGCATSSQLVTGAARDPLAPAQVRVYTSAPATFQEVAIFSASRESVTSTGGERAIEKMIESMRAQAAQLGANGLLLEDFSDAPSTTLGSDVVSETYTHNGSINIGVGGSIALTKKIAKSRAIYVPPAD
ncbi:MAG TPA: hypothetical protein VGG61_16545 [Gemmataceae bacterium]